MPHASIPIPTRRQLDPSPPAMGGGTRRVGRARWAVCGCPEGAHPSSLGEHDARNAPLPDAGSRALPLVAEQGLARPRRPRSKRKGARRLGAVGVDAGLSCWTFARGDGHSLRAVHELHRRHVCLGLRHHPWRSSTGLLGADERPARPSPLAEHVPHRDGAAASPTCARTTRRAQRRRSPWRGGVLLANFRGEITNQ